METLTSNNSGAGAPAAQSYPITPAPEDDPRFAVGLMLDVAEVLERHGYPPATGDDLAGLQQALYRYLYVGGLR